MQRMRVAAAVEALRLLPGVPDSRFIDLRQKIRELRRNHARAPSIR